MPVRRRPAWPRTMLTSLEAVEMAEVIGCVASKEAWHYPGGKLQILLVDTERRRTSSDACKGSSDRFRVPWHYPWETYLDQVDGLMLTNGPGDPAQLSEPIHLRRVRHALHAGLPLLAICLWAINGWR